MTGKGTWHRPLCFLAALVALDRPAAAAPSPSDIIVREGLGAKLDDYLQRLADWGYSGTVLVAKNGEIILQKGYGLADREKKVPMTPDTVMSVGSITKQFTAAAILKLEMQGKLDVRDPISKYFSGVPKDKEAITLHHLLTHSAGLQSDFGDDFEKVSRDEIIKRALASKLRSKPGERYAYANSGYSLLGAIVEIVSGQGYETFLQENLFKPAGMTQTGYRLPKWRPEDVAVGYERGKRWGTEIEKPWAEDGPYWNLRCNGGIHSTIGDMYKWHLALEGEAVLSKAAKEKLFTPHVPEGGDSFYGYGWGISKTARGTKLIGHNGSNGIFYAEFRRYVDEGVVVYCATNVDELANGRVGSWIDRVLFGGGEVPTPPHVVAVDAALLPKYAGSYRLPSGGRLVVTVHDGKLSISAEGADAFALLASGERGDVKLLEGLTARTKAIVEARMKKDIEPLYQALGGRLPRARLEDIVAQSLREWEEEHGPYQSYEVLGSVPGGGLGLTYVRMKFARGSVMLCYEWDKDRLTHVRPVSLPPATRTFQPESATEFAAFSVSLPTVVRIQFRSDGGNVTGLAVRGKAGEVLATRGGS
jgi:CubicO group peptidase (beta-lactamase class C family)